MLMRPEGKRREQVHKPERIIGRLGRRSPKAELVLEHRAGMVRGDAAPVDFRMVPDALDEQQFGQVVHRRFLAIVGRVQSLVIIIFRAGNARHVARLHPVLNGIGHRRKYRRRPRP